MGGACEAGGALDCSRVPCVTPRVASTLWHRHTANKWNLAYLLYTYHRWGGGGEGGILKGREQEKKSTSQAQARKKITSSRYM